jgi:pSer/pThr/pTyr-binding forkhead associated (FHA) protein
MTAMVILLKQKVLNSVAVENKEECREQGYDENNYWEDELSVEEADDEKTVLLTEYRKNNCFALKAESGSKVKIGTFPFVIGKFKEKVDYCIDDVTISRLHAKLDEYDENILLVTDLNSTNGTFVGERRLKANEVVKLKLNETLTIGDYSFKLIKDF